MKKILFVLGMILLFTVGVKGNDFVTENDNPEIVEIKRGSYTALSAGDATIQVSIDHRTDLTKEFIIRVSK